jgi:energy-coupling factor transport system ATP-binding protein
MQIKADNLTYKYMKNTPFEKEALKGFSITIPEGRFTSVIGHTGSGKSTFIQHLNGLLKPSSGTVTVGDWTIRPDTKQKHLYELRRHASIVFQFPEHQLFHETVLSDVAYGPVNFGLSKLEAEKRAKEYLELAGIHPDMFDRSPFDLSGGQMRRVAIAGVLALNPKLLILDEPTAGLDPEGQVKMMELFYDWFQEKKERSIILVTHQMEDAARYSDEIVLMDKGTVKDQGRPHQIFSKAGELEAMGLSVPESVKLLSILREQSGEDISTAVFTLDETVDQVLGFLRKRGVSDRV